MANNLLYVCCGKCNDHAYLTKHFGGSYFLDSEAVEHLNDFILAHACCAAVFLAEEDGDAGSLTGREMLE